MLETSQYTAFKITNNLLFTTRHIHNLCEWGFYSKAVILHCFSFSQEYLRNWQLMSRYKWCKGFFSIFFFNGEALLHTRKHPELSLMSGWIKLEALQITACMLAQQTGRCRCYLLHPGDPDTTQQSEEREDLWVSGANKQGYEKDMNILAEGGRWWWWGELKASANIFTTVHWNVLACIYISTCASVAKWLVLYVINITPAPHYAHVHYSYVLRTCV